MFFICCEITVATGCFLKLRMYTDYMDKTKIEMSSVTTIEHHMKLLHMLKEEERVASQEREVKYEVSIDALRPRVREVVDKLLTAKEYFAEVKNGNELFDDVRVKRNFNYAPIQAYENAINSNIDVKIKDGLWKIYCEEEWVATFPEKFIGDNFWEYVLDECLRRWKQWKHDLREAKDTGVYMAELGAQLDRMEKRNLRAIMYARGIDAHLCIVSKVDTPEVSGEAPRIGTHTGRINYREAERLSAQKLSESELGFITPGSAIHVGDIIVGFTPENGVKEGTAGMVVDIDERNTDDVLCTINYGLNEQGIIYSTFILREDLNGKRIYQNYLYTMDKVREFNKGNN